jgi:hypothetical protein
MNDGVAPREKFHQFQGCLRRATKEQEKIFGGEGGIRTPDTVTRMPHFECGAFNRSATSPHLALADVIWAAGQAQS